MAIRPVRANAICPYDLNPTGKVYNVQTTDDLGNFTVGSSIGAHLVEIVGDGFYMDELTGQLAASRIQLRAVADLSVDNTPTVNTLTSLQAQRLKTLITQGSTYAVASTQSQNEVLAAFGIDQPKLTHCQRCIPCRSTAPLTPIQYCLRSPPSYPKWQPMKRWQIQRRNLPNFPTTSAQSPP